MLPPEKLEAYRAGWRARRSGRAIDNKRRSDLALKKALLAASAIKEKYGCRVLLFGSLAGSGKFGAHSDIDLGLEGLSQGADFWRLCAEMMEVLHPFEADIVLIETLDPAIRRHAQENGLWL